MVHLTSQKKTIVADNHFIVLRLVWPRFKSNVWKTFHRVYSIWPLCMVSKDGPKEIAIKFYVLFVHSLSVASEWLFAIKRIRMRNAIESTRCTFQIRYITDFHIALTLKVFVCVCVFLFSLIESEVQCASDRIILVEMSFAFIAMPLFIWERSTFEMANKMMMSCWWCILTTAQAHL